MHQNTPFAAKIKKKISGEGAQSPPQTQPRARSAPPNLPNQLYTCGAARACLKGPAFSCPPFSVPPL